MHNYFIMHIVIIMHDYNIVFPLDYLKLFNRVASLKNGLILSSLFGHLFLFGRLIKLFLLAQVAQRKVVSWIFLSFCLINFLKLQYGLPFHHGTRIPRKFHFKQNSASKVIKQILTFPKQTQAKTGFLSPTKNSCTQWWSMDLTRQNLIYRNNVLS